MVALLLLAAGLARGGEVTLELRNGDRVSGILVSESDGRIRIRHPSLGLLRIAVGDVTNRITAPLLPPSATATAVASAPAPSPAPASVPAGGASPKPPTPPPTAAGVAAAKPAAPKPPPPRHWNFDMQAGLDLGFGATDRHLYNARARALYAREKLHNSMDAMFTYGQAGGIRSADRLDGLMKTDYEIGRRLFLYNLGGGGRDAIRHLDLHYETGPGLGYHLIRMDRLKLNTELGGNYQSNRYSDGTEAESFFYRIAEDAIWQATPKLAFDQKLEFFPGITDMERYRIRFEGNMRYALRGNLYLNLTALNLYDNHPPQGISRNDLQLRSSVGVKF